MTYYSTKPQGTHGTRNENEEIDVQRPRSVVNLKSLQDSIGGSTADRPTTRTILSDKTNFVNVESVVVDPYKKRSTNVSSQSVGKENIPPASMKVAPSGTLNIQRNSNMTGLPVRINDDNRVLPAATVDSVHSKVAHKIPVKRSTVHINSTSHSKPHSVSSILKSTTNAVVEKKSHNTETKDKQQQQQQQHKGHLQEKPIEFAADATEEEKQGIKEFFKDNEERFPPLEDAMEPVPILPIAVPERLKRRFAMDTKTQKVMRVTDIPADTVDISRYISMLDLTNTVVAPMRASLKTAAVPYNDDLSTATTEQQTEFTNFLMKQGPHLFNDRSEQHSDYAKSGDKYSILHQTNNDEIFDPNITPLRFVANQQTVETDRREQANRRRMDFARRTMLTTSECFTDEQIKDPMMVAEYVDEIYDYLYETELIMLPDANYVKVQSPEFSWNMRSILVDWVIEIHFLFGLMPETLFLAVNIIDRFLSVRQIALGKMQLVGLTSLFIAAKFEELASPLINDYLHMTDNNYTESQMKDAERFILDALDFRLLYPHPLNFIRRICSKEDFNDINVRTLAKYFAEISCLDERLIAVRPSKIAAASVWLANKMLAQHRWKGPYRNHCGYATADLKEIVEVMLDYLSRSEKHPAFFFKWKQDNVSKASMFVDEWLKKYYRR